MCHHHTSCGDDCLLTAGFLMVVLTREPNLCLLLRMSCFLQKLTVACFQAGWASSALNPLAASLNGSTLSHMGNT